MSTKSLSLRAVLAATSATLIFAGCSGGSGDPSTAPEGTDAPDVSVVIDQEILDALNSDTGEAVVPGSIESVRVETLDEACTEAVGALRELMAEYPSLRQVPPDGTYDEAFAAAKAGCEPSDPQQWADFYTKELAGWIYAAVDVSGETTITSEPPATADPAAPDTDAEENAPAENAPEETTTTVAGG